MSRSPLGPGSAFAFATVIALGGPAACSPEEASAPLETRRDDGAPPPAFAPPSGPDAAAAPAPGTQVTIRVRDRDGEPVVGRAVTLVDARGARSRGLTDEEGGFVFEGVVRPYDCAVEGAPLRAGGGVPTVLAGLRTERADVDVDEAADAPASPSQTLRLAVRIACDDPPCEGWAISSSAAGEGATQLDGLAASTIAPLEIEHRWRSAAPMPGERIVVRVLLASRTRSSFWFAEGDGGSAHPGEVHDLGTLDPSIVRASEVRVGTSKDALPGTWRSGTQVALRFDDGAAAELGAFDAPARALWVPQVPAASLRVDAWAERLDATSADLHTGVRAEASAPLSVSALSLDLRPGPKLRVPRPGGRVSRRSPGLAWDLGGSPSLVRATVVVDDDRGGVLLRFSTSGDALSFARLGRLGLPRWPVGRAVLELDALEGVELDDWVDPTRARPVATSTSSRRVRFVVTP